MADDFVWTEELVGEFLGGTGSPEELRFDVGLVTNLELRRLEAVSVGRLLVALLSVADVVLQMVVEVTEVHSEFACARQGDIALGVHG